MHPNNHLLPPVHNVGVVFLKEEFAEGEEDLHNARFALQEFEKNPLDAALKKTLHMAMEKLEERETNYARDFARRYSTNPKTVISGWKEWQEWGDDVSVSSGGTDEMNALD